MRSTGDGVSQEGERETAVELGMRLEDRIWRSRGRGEDLQSAWLASLAWMMA